MSSIAAQMRLLSSSDYGSINRSPVPGEHSTDRRDIGVSKLALNRLIEFIALGNLSFECGRYTELITSEIAEYAGSVTAFALHPGSILTDMGKVSSSCLQARTVSEIARIGLWHV